ncbi:hypothetical protein [Paenibacillus albidus]|uniref:hypothetical protein n=1 Tax=Paenibacillus albidus TaxID=2041023 RepID=UPI001BEC26B1|nr:hypothetical protein [Paenibacillus albidus]
MAGATTVGDCEGCENGEDFKDWEELRLLRLLQLLRRSCNCCSVLREAFQTVVKLHSGAVVFEGSGKGLMCPAAPQEPFSHQLWFHNEGTGTCG